MKKRKIRKVEKKSNFEKNFEKKRSGEESLWITVVIHSEMCVGKQ